MAPKIEMIGRRFDRLLVLAEAESSRAPCGKVRRNYVVRCDCGIEKNTDGHALRIGRTRSCGCHHEEQLRSKKLGWKHGEAPSGKQSAEYKAWAGMARRCENPKAANYPRYGGRGIKVCPEWRHDFPAFLAHVGRRPSPQYSIDRYPNNDGNYEPDNVRWATGKEQQANRRISKKPALSVRSA